MNFQRLNELVPKSASAATFVAIVLAAASIANAQTETVLYSFKGGVDGGNLSARLAVDGKGNLYGTTASGGPVPKNGPSPNHGGGHFGNGTVFEITPDGREKVLYNFKGGQDGSAPVSGLVRDGHGNLYGTTLYGGTSQPGTSGFGTVFQVAPDGTKKTLYSFQGGADGAYPWGDLTRDSRGHLYGITQQGGAFGGGTVFEISPDGTEKRLHEFTMGADGGSPTSGVVLDTNGNLYGTIPCINNVCIGGVFQIAPDGTYTLLYTFQGGLDGYYPWSEVVRDAAGNLYGTTSSGGPGYFGTVF